LIAPATEQTAGQFCNAEFGGAHFNGLWPPVRWTRNWVDFNSKPLQGPRVKAGASTCLMGHGTITRLLIKGRRGRIDRCVRLLARSRALLSLQSKSQLSSATGGIGKAWKNYFANFVGITPPRGMALAYEAGGPNLLDHGNFAVFLPTGNGLATGRVQGNFLRGPKAVAAAKRGRHA